MDCIHKDVMQLRVGSSFLRSHASPITTREIEVTSKENDGIPRFTCLIRRLSEGPQAGFISDMGHVVRSYKETLPALTLYSDSDDLAVWSGEARFFIADKLLSCTNGGQCLRLPTSINVKSIQVSVPMMMSCLVLWMRKLISVCFFRNG